MVGIVSAIAIVGFTARMVQKRVFNKPKYTSEDLVSPEFAKDASPSSDSATRFEATPATAATGEQKKLQFVDLSRRDSGNAQPKSQGLPAVDLSKRPDFLAQQKGQHTTPVEGHEGSLPREKQEKIKEMVRDFFSAKSLTEMLPLVRDSGRVKTLMQDYYQRNPMTNWHWKGIGWAMPVEEKGFSYVQVLFDDAPPVHVVVEETADGKFEIDWESAVHYCELSWKDFQSRKPLEPKVFRVIASKLDSNDGVSGDGEKQTTLKLTHPQEDGVVYGKFDQTDPQFRSLLEQLNLCKWKDVPVILRLCYPGPSSSAVSVQIAGVEGKGWLILDDVPRS